MAGDKNTKILEQFKNKKAAIFIDDANLFYMQKRVAWEIRRIFHTFFEDIKGSVEKINPDK